jgi:hypothetical protein
MNPATQEERITKIQQLRETLQSLPDNSNLYGCVIINDDFDANTNTLKVRISAPVMMNVTTLEEVVQWKGEFSLTNERKFSKQFASTTEDVYYISHRFPYKPSSPQDRYRYSIGSKSKTSGVLIFFILLFVAIGFLFLSMEIEEAKNNPQQNQNQDHNHNRVHEYEHKVQKISKIHKNEDIDNWE